MHADPRRWRALGVIAIAQLMVVLDASIVNIALPSAQADLNISDANRQWMVTAYTLAFGGFLLLGGRIADYSGRKRCFVIGLVGFAVASAIGGAANGQEMLFAARALQGLFGALLAPAALSLLTVTFTDVRERAKAFGVYGAIAGGGAAIGLIVGGVLTEYLDWRWCLFVNIPIAILAAVAARRVLSESKADGSTSYDIPGAVLSTLGLVSLVFGFTQAETHGWGSPKSWGYLVAAGFLLVGFVVWELRSDNPLLPMRVLTERNRGGAYLTSLLLGVGMFGMFLFMTYYFQLILGYSALKTGFAFLPFSIGIIVSAAAASQLLPRFGPRATMLTGFVLAILGMLGLAQLTPTSSYGAHVLPVLTAMAIGMGLIFVPLSNTALTGVKNHDAGVASALVNTTQQIGGSLGTALLNTIAASATTAYIVSHGVSAQARAEGTVHGFTTAFYWSAAFLAVAAVAVAVLVNTKAETAHDGAPAHFG
ncbi:MFS transporter [Actinocorallia longicatena]|uniref:MFS transporter n=1 Tax=Actinocorallia longicatena TaxID=111803 RepID=UPI0031CE470F